MYIYILDKKQLSIDYHYLQITIKTCDKQVVQQQIRLNFKGIFFVTSEVRFRLDK